MLLSACGPKSKSPGEIENEAATLANQYMAANKFSESEVTLQDALMKTSSPWLMFKLVELYEKTQQWKKLDDYIEVNGSSLTWFQLQNTQRALSTHYFDDKNWERAALFSKKAAATETFQSGVSEANKACPMVAPENLRNAAAAYSNAKNGVGVSEAYTALVELSRDKRCQSSQSQSEIRRQADSVSQMMR